jgi:hypothetical protein
VSLPLFALIAQARAPVNVEPEVIFADILRMDAATLDGSVTQLLPELRTGRQAAYKILLKCNITY